MYQNFYKHKKKSQNMQDQPKNNMMSKFYEHNKWS